MVGYSIRIGTIYCKLCFSCSDSVQKDKDQSIYVLHCCCFFYFVVLPHIVFVIVQNINMKILFSSNRRTDFIRSISTYCKSNLWHWTTEQLSSVHQFGWFFYLSLCLIRRLLASLHLSGFSIRHSLSLSRGENE